MRDNGPVARDRRGAAEGNVRAPESTSQCLARSCKGRNKTPKPLAPSPPTPCGTEPSAAGLSGRQPGGLRTCTGPRRSAHVAPTQPNATVRLPNLPHRAVIFLGLTDKTRQDGQCFVFRAIAEGNATTSGGGNPSLASTFFGRAPPVQYLRVRWARRRRLKDTSPHLRGPRSLPLGMKHLKICDRPSTSIRIKHVSNWHPCGCGAAAACIWLSAATNSKGPSVYRRETTGGRVRLLIHEVRDRAEQTRQRVRLSWDRPQDRLFRLRRPTLRLRLGHRRDTPSRHLLSLYKSSGGACTKDNVPCTDTPNTSTCTPRPSHAM